MVMAGRRLSMPSSRKPGGASTVSGLPAAESASDLIKGPGFPRPSGACPRCAAGRAATWTARSVLWRLQLKGPLPSLACAA